MPRLHFLEECKIMRKAKKTSKPTVIVCISIIAVAIIGLFVAMFIESKSEGGIFGIYNTDEVIYFDNKQYVPKSNLQTLLIAGVDRTGEVTEQEYNNAGQCDFIALVVIDRNHKTYKILHINRDTMTNVPVLGITGEETDRIYAQIALSHAYGDGLDSSCKNVLNAVSDYLYGIKIDDYIVLNIDAVGIINDSLGGVEVTLEEDFTEYDSEMENGKTMRLNGEQAIIYTRYRYGVGDSTNVNRMSRQKKFIESLSLSAREAMESDNQTALKLFDAIDKYMLSSMNKSQFGGLASKLYSYENEGYISIEGENVKGEEFMEFYPDENDLKAKVIDLFYKEK